MNFKNFLRTPFIQNAFERLLLFFVNYFSKKSSSQICKRVLNTPLDWFHLNVPNSFMADLQSKSVDCFLYDRDLCHVRVILKNLNRLETFNDKPFFANTPIYTSQTCSFWCFPPILDDIWENSSKLLLLLQAERHLTSIPYTYQSFTRLRCA